MDGLSDTPSSQFVAELGLELSSLELQGIELSAAWEERML